MNEEQLIQYALNARKNAYAPYSGYKVGAALLAQNGQVFTGCNVENAAYGPSNCAERTAFFKAVSEGIRDFEAIAIVGGKLNEISDYAYPCGVCRQVMMEFCEATKFQIIVATDSSHFECHSLEELLPNGFGAANLQ